MSDVLRRLNRNDEAILLLERALPAAEQLQLGGAFFRLGTLLIEQKDYETAERQLKHCLEIRQATLAPTDEAIREAMEGIAEVYRLTGRLADSERLLAAWPR